MKQLKKFWTFLKSDSWASLFVTLILAFILIKFIFFPVLSLVTGSSLPLVIVESCSMYHHEYGFERILNTSRVYEENAIRIEDTTNWPFQNGLKKGDVIFVVGPDKIKKGDVIIFNAGSAYPFIHRVVKNYEPYSTKGDNYITNSGQHKAEVEIDENDILGKALFRVPAIGWIKLIFFEGLREPQDRGLCS